VETFFQFFEERTGYPKPAAQQVVQIISGYLARNYKKEFAVIIQYFLANAFDHTKPANDTSLEWLLKNHQNV
jgi:hypothetical protein